MATEEVCFWKSCFGNNAFGRVHLDDQLGEHLFGIFSGKEQIVPKPKCVGNAKYMCLDKWNRALLGLLTGRRNPSKKLLTYIRIGLQVAARRARVAAGINQLEQQIPGKNAFPGSSLDQQLHDRSGPQASS